MKLIIFGVGIPSSWYGPCSREDRIAIRGGKVSESRSNFFRMEPLIRVALRDLGRTKKA
jgi:hypothetical protein